MCGKQRLEPICIHLLLDRLPRAFEFPDSVGLQIAEKIIEGSGGLAEASIELKTVSQGEGDHFLEFALNLRVLRIPPAETQTHRCLDREVIVRLCAVVRPVSHRAGFRHPRPARLQDGR